MKGCGAGLGAASTAAWRKAQAEAAAPKSDAPLRLIAGVAKRKVTPPTWVPYLTSSGNGTCAPFQGVHDDLHARALVLEDSRQAIALLAVDSIGYDNTVLGPGRDFTRELRRRVAARTGLQPQAIMLCASHSHSTPETIGLTNFRDFKGVPDWVEQHLQDLVAVTVAAWKQRVPVRAYAGSTQVQGVARYRRIVLKNGTLNRHGPLPSPAEVAVPWKLDEELALLHLETESGQPHSLVMNYTAHPVIAMLLPPVSADYPGAAAALVERELKGVVCLFTQGAAGNVNSAHVTTNFEDVESLGHKLGGAALAQVKRMTAKGAMANPQVRVVSESVELEPRPCPPLAEAEQALQKAPTSADRQWLRLARKLAEAPLRAEVQAMRVGGVTWVSLPGEPFVETGLALKAAGATFVAGYANGWLGYLPTHRAYAEGGYEVIPGPWSRVAPGSAERLEAVAARLLQQVT